MRGVINFGHGPKDIGYDPGAIGPTGYQEATETREVGTRVAQKLRTNGWDILVIQDGDLWDITNQSNDWHPDVFLSIHGNSFTPEAHGIETFALEPGGKGQVIATEIQKELVAATGLTDRGVKFANYHVLRETIGYPAVLTEIAFISNPEEEALMKQDSWDDLVASAICRGLSRAVKMAYTDAPASVPQQHETVPKTNPEPAPAPISSEEVRGFSYPNNAQVVGDDLYIRDENGNRIPGRYVANGDNITVLDVSYSKQLTLVEYPTPAGVRSGYVKNIPSLIRYYFEGQWRNGSTPEPVVDGSGSAIGSLDPREKATPLYRKGARIHVVYNTVKGPNTKSGFVKWEDGFTKF